MHNEKHFSRRTFLKTAGLLGAAFPFVTRNLLAQSPNETIRHASFGCASMAGQDLEAITRVPGVKLVAVADVDLKHTVKIQKKFPGVKVYQDWREMLDKEKGLDSVNVSTPDHMHAPMAMSAMQLGLHVYGQKPLAHDLFEVRRMTEYARKKKLITQMGIQVHSMQAYRLGVRLIQDLAIGKVREVHTWSCKKWGDDQALPQRTDPVPDGFNWDLWLGVASARPFLGDGYYHPGNWRKRLDFGTGTFGDMGCHIYDPVFKALGVGAPISVRSEGPAPNRWNWAVNAVIEYVFPGTPYTAGATVKVVWYDGDQRPPREILALLGDTPAPDQGSIFVGEKGVMLLPHVAAPVLLPEKQFEDYPMPKVQTADHWAQWVECCRTRQAPWANFDYAGPLTEAILLGAVATHFPKTTLQWDARKLAFTNLKEANAHVRREYRKGWQVRGL